MRRAHCESPVAGGMNSRATWKRKSRIALFLILAWTCCLPTLSAQVPPTIWQEGRVLAAELNGQGPGSQATATKPQRRYIWWTYCVSTKGIGYTAVLRESPTKTGMKVGSRIRLSVLKNRMVVANPNGKNFVLRVTRQSDGPACK